MASMRQMLELMRSHVDGDDERFRATALQLAALEARQGHGDLAKEIQRLLEKSGARQEAPIKPLQLSNSISIAQPTGELAGLLDTVEPSLGLEQMVLPQDLRGRLDRVVQEQRYFSQIREHGLHPRQKLLLLGPPGCGKTMTAHALAHDLGLPLFVVRLDGLVTKFLGETTSKLRLVFDAVERYRAVFLFDEFDSLGLARGAQHDVAEMRRVLNSMLVFIDGLKGNSIVIAASNHPEALDVALFRRFDDILTYELPSKAEVEKVLRSRLSGQETHRVSWAKVLTSCKKLSYADAARVADEVIKERLINHLPEITTRMLTDAIEQRTKQRGSK